MKYTALQFMDALHHERITSLIHQTKLKTIY